MNFFKPIFTGLTALGLAVSGWLGLVPASHITNLQEKVQDLQIQVSQIHLASNLTSEEALGAYGISGGSTYHLRSSLNSTGATINLASFKEPVSNTPYTMSYLNTTVGYGTLDPQSARSEFISWTGITQNSDGTAALTGVTRGLTRSPAGVACTASSTLALTHPAQAIFLMSSDSPCHFAEYAVKRNDESITGSWSFAAPTAGSNPATKDFVTTLVNGGTVSTDKVVVAATAGETIATGTLVFFDRFQNEWMKTDADFASSTENIVIGVAQGAGTNGLAISGGVLTQGLDTTQIGMTTSARIYISSTAGATSTSAGTFARQIGIAKSATGLYVTQGIDRLVGSEFITTNATSTNATTTTLKISGAFNLATSTNPILGSGFLMDIGKNIQVCTANCTWTRPSGITRILITLVGGGGGGGGTAGSNTAAGGGAGATCIRSIDVTATTTVNAVIGALGSGGSAGGANTGTTGGTSRFSTFCVATGGVGGQGANGNDGGTGGTSTSGDLNISGQRGGNNPTAYGTGTLSGAGGNSTMGFGGFGVHTTQAGNQAQAVGYGAGGAGSSDNQAGGDGTAGVLIIQW